MHETYYKYAQSDCLGTVNIAPHASRIINLITKDNPTIILPALNRLNFFNLHTGENLGFKEASTKSENPITCIHKIPLLNIEIKLEVLNETQSTPVLIAAGYQSGQIDLFRWEGSIETLKKEHSFNFHKKAITAFCDDSAKSIFVSGSKDTDVIIWDSFNGSGVRRLKGHTNEITSLVIKERTLFSSSKDGLVKCWDLDTFTCIKSLVGHHGEVWSVCYDTKLDLLLSGSFDSKVRIWEVKEASGGLNKTGSSVKAEKTPLVGMDIVYGGSFDTSARRRILQIEFSDSLLYVSNSNKKIDVFKRKAKNRSKRVAIVKSDGIKKLKTENGLKASDNAVELLDSLPSTSLGLKSALKPYYKVTTITTKDKISSILPVTTQSKEILVVALSNNSTLVYSHQKSANSTKSDFFTVKSFNKNGHRSSIFSSDLDKTGSRLLTACANYIKLWSLKTGECVRTFKSLRANPFTKAAFAPASMAAASLKSGGFELFDLNTAESCGKFDESVEVTAITADNATNSLLTGSSAGEIKFWGSLSAQKGQPPLKHIRSLNLEEQINCIETSRCGKFVAAGLINSTVKVHYLDSLRFFLSLYGHKLPVLCIDISRDSKILVSGSADKNIKIWGLDFGDCHKSIFAHDKSVTSVKFVGASHLFFSAGRDKLVKFWDGDKFDQLMVLRGHCADVLSLAVSENGSKCCSTSSDMSIRVWERTDEQLFPEEEDELELERKFEKSQKRDFENEAVPGVIEGSGLDSLPGSLAVAHKSKDALSLAEKLTLAVESVFPSDVGVNAEIEKLVAVNFAPVIKQPALTDLEDALSILPYHIATKILRILLVFIENNPIEYERGLRSILRLAKIHELQLLGDSEMAETMVGLYKKCVRKGKGLCNLAGVNVASLSLAREKRDALQSDNTLFVKEDEDAFVDHLEKLAVGFDAED